MIETALCIDCEWWEKDDDPDSLDRLTEDHEGATGHTVYIVQGDEAPTVA